MKNIKNKSIIVLILTITMLFFIIKDDFVEIASLLQSTNLFWLIIAIIIFYLGLFIESISLKLIASKYNHEYGVLKAFRLNVITKFFNGITPLASGGQPLQVYELTKSNIKVSDGTTIIVENFLVYQTALMSITIISFILNIVFKFVSFSNTLSILFALGFFFNMVTLVFAYIVGINKNIARNIVVFLAKILAKIRIVKDKHKVIRKLEDTCDDFYYSFREMQKNKSIFIKGFFLQFLGLSLTFLTVIFVFEAININVSIPSIFCGCLAVFIFISGSFVPIPGGTGGMEYCFFNFFSTLITGTVLKSSLLLWRFVTYLFPVLVGGIVFNIHREKK